MRKYLFILICLFITNYGFSNKITIKNYTGCSFKYSFRGLGDSLDATSYFESEEILIPPNDSVVFISPSAIPSLAYLPSTSTFYYIKGYCIEMPAAGATNDVSMGDSAWGYTSPLITSNNNYYPACKGGALIVTWFQDSNNDIIVTIL